MNFSQSRNSSGSGVIVGEVKLFVNAQIAHGGEMSGREAECIDVVITFRSKSWLSDAAVKSRSLIACIHTIDSRASLRLPTVRNSKS